MFQGLMHKTTYFKGKGRQEQEGTKITPKTKGNKESKNYCKNVVTTVKISFLFFFFHGGGVIGIDVTRYMFACVLLMQQPWNIMLLAYFTYKNLTKCHRKVIPAYPYKKIKFSGKVYVVA